MRLNRDKRELTERNQRMLSMRHDGMTLREIGAVFGVTDVRVFAITERERKRQQLEPLYKLSCITPLTQVS
jgi:DNA-directed RNA polymerase specialized sigma subunit